MVSENERASPRLECDIVMAGGVTSGIIYPGALAMIVRKFRFRSIGGTSVGAIAAAVTGAAEYGRQTGKKPNAFEILRTLPKAAWRGGRRQAHAPLSFVYAGTSHQTVTGFGHASFAQGERVKQIFQILGVTCSYRR